MSNQVHESAFIGEGVTLGANVTIGPFAVILGKCTIGDNVWIGSNAAIGGPPEMSSLTQNAAWTGDLQYSGVEIESDVVIREGVVIHQGFHRPTRISSGAWILNRTYLAHDVQVGSEAIISAGVSIGWHCIIGERVNIGMNASIHQRRIVGAGAIIGMSTPVTKDIPPYAKVLGSPIRIWGINRVTLERQKVSNETQRELEAIYTTDEIFERLQSSMAIQSIIGEDLLEWLALDPQNIACA